MFLSPPFILLHAQCMSSRRVINAAQELGSKSKALALIVLLVSVMGDAKKQEQEQEQDGKGCVIVQLAPHIVAPLPGVWAAAQGAFGGGGGKGEEEEGGTAMVDLRNGVMAVLIGLLPRVGPGLAQVDHVLSGQVVVDAHTRKPCLPSVSPSRTTPQGYHPTILPMLDAATDVRRPESLLLLEDGLKLWHVALTQTAAYDAQGKSGRAMLRVGAFFSTCAVNLLPLSFCWYVYVCHRHRRPLPAPGGRVGPRLRAHQGPFISQNHVQHTHHLTNQSTDHHIR